MDRPKLEVADIFRRYGEAYRQDCGASLSTAQRRVMSAIEVCRTETPAWQQIAPGHFVGCHRAHELQLAGVD
jgi:hypothetical protein